MSKRGLQQDVDRIVEMNGGPLPPETDAGLFEAQRRLADLRFLRKELYERRNIGFDDEDQLIIPTIDKLEEELVDFIECVHPEGLTGIAVKLREMAVDVEPDDPIAVLAGDVYRLALDEARKAANQSSTPAA